MRNESLKVHVLTRSLSLLETGGTEAITARAIAADAATSTAAIYELFGDKGGLVRAMFQVGFELLVEGLESIPDRDDPKEAVRDTLNFVRSFALERPQLFSVMFGRPFAEFEPDPHDKVVAAKIYNHSLRLVAAWLGGRIRSAANVDAANVLIALNRGLIEQERSGILGGSAKSIGRRRDLAITAMLDGLENTAR